MTAVSDTPTAEAHLPRDPIARLEALFDPGTMSVLTAVPYEGSGAVAAAGLIDGSGAVSFASDPRVQGGAMGVEGCAVIAAAYDEAITRGVPIIGLWHSGGARLAEGVASLHGVGLVFAAWYSRR
jgi:acetyl-CoA/propionyl-CoA carboxylase carboxyl transferase subunit